MPPPNRAKIEISEAPKPSATMESTTVRSFGARCSVPSKEAEIKRHAQQRQACNQKAGDRTGAERKFKPSGE